MIPLLQINQISKHFGSLVALQNVNLQIFPGEIVGLAGRSGAGKSTLIKILSGQITPDSGSVYYNGLQQKWPLSTRKLGIGVIHQQPELADHLDITSNVFLGNEICWSLFGQWPQVPNRRKMDREAVRLLASLDLHLSSLRKGVTNLSSEQRQLVAIAKAMVRPYTLMMVDDPSPLLSYPYQQKLLDLIRSWHQQGCAVLFCSDNLDHLFAVTDRIAVLCQGEQITDLYTDETTREEIVAAIVGTTERQRRTPAIWALDSYYQARNQAETLRHNQMLLERNLAAQDTLNKQLVDQLAEQVKALDSANLALQDAQRRLLTEREQERKHLARELHDQMIQILFSINYQLEELEAKAKKSMAIEQDVAAIRSKASTLIDDLRRICGNLRPPTIDSLGLDAALQSYINEWRQQTGIAVILDLDAEFGRLPEAIELSIFRIVQEGLNNVWKHTAATEVEVSLRHTSPRMLLISIADNGAGLEKDFDLAALSSTGHYGLLGISERVALMGGRLNFRNQPNSGLLVQAEIPHPKVG